MTAPPLPHSLERVVTIAAPRQVVFGYFTDSAKWAAWWGPGSTIDARPGGQVSIRQGAAEVSGEVLEIVAPERIVFTHGFVSGTPIPPGGSRVTIRLDDVNGATRLHLTHEFAEAGTRDLFVQGWRYQLSVFGNVVADDRFAQAAAVVDAWFTAWSNPDDAVRDAALDVIARPSIAFRDRHSLIEGLDDLRPHLAAVHRFMPGVRIARDGDVRHCQGTVLADWTAATVDGQPRGRGTNVFTFDADGRIAGVTGFWARDVTAQ
jgi:uncharacterized protein YndB with AHSA1/START domain